MQDPSPKRRRRLFAAVLAALLLGLLEIGSCVAISFAPSWYGKPIRSSGERLALHAEAAEGIRARRPNALAEFHPELGWRPRPGTSNGVDEINSLGLRSAREYPPEVPPGVVRVSVFGDSFVYGSEVGGANSWPAQLEAKRSDVEVLNYGVPAYGPDQALLRLESEAALMKPDWVILAIGPVAATRAVSVTAAFRQPEAGSFTKPRFRVSGEGELELVSNPFQGLEDAKRFGTREGVIGLGANDYWYQASVYENPLYDWLSSVRLLTVLWGDLRRRHLDPDRPLTGAPGAAQLNRESTSFRIMAAIAERSQRAVIRMGSRPALIVLPDLYSLRASSEGLPGICQPLLDFCEERGLRCWDATEAFLPLEPERSLSESFARRGHYTKAGNARVADWLAERLEPKVQSSP